MKGIAGLHSRDWGWRGATVYSALLAATLTALALATDRAVLLVILVSILYVLFALISVREPLALATTFMAILVVLPPFFLSRFGDTPIYISGILLPICLAVVVVRLPDFRLALDPIARGLGLFLVGTGLSLPFAFWLSGPELGTQSLFRWLMLCQTALIYLLIRGGARIRESRGERRMVQILLLAAVLTAAYGIIDFVWPVPLPHPAADQFIWLRSTIIRRAQGVFYESSNFANLCGFFLAMSAAAFLSRKERLIGFPRSVLLAFIAVLSLAVLVAFSRGAWANVITTVMVFAVASGQLRLRRGVGFFVVLGVPLGVLWYYSPELWNYFLDARMGHLVQLFADPNLASSGRFETWSRVVSIMTENPQYLLFGVGYKTLPYTRLFHSEIITDNGYLNLLLETGVLGLSGFLFFCTAVFRTFYRLARFGRGNSAFWSTLLFAFWCGECVQTLTVDAYTYWRNMVVFAGFMALTMNLAEREQIVESQAGRRLENEPALPEAAP
jgi:O-Antigen ligase